MITTLSSGAVLESLGDETLMDVRKEKFTNADTDNDGWITYDEFLSVSRPLLRKRTHSTDNFVD